MDEKTPLDHLLDQMNELLMLISDGTAKGIKQDAIPEDFEERMDKIKRDVEKFSKLGDQVVSLSGLSSVEMQKYQDGMVENIAPEGKALMDKAKHLKKRADAIEESYNTGLREPPEKIPDDPEYGKHRRKKFKRFGSSEWKRL